MSESLTITVKSLFGDPDMYVNYATQPHRVPHCGQARSTASGTTGDDILRINQPRRTAATSSASTPSVDTFYTIAVASAGSLVPVGAGQYLRGRAAGRPVQLLPLQPADFPIQWRHALVRRHPRVRRPRPVRQRHCDAAQRHLGALVVHYGGHGCGADPQPERAHGQLVRDSDGGARRALLLQRVVRRHQQPERLPVFTFYQIPAAASRAIS